MELFKLLGKIVVDNKEAKEKIGETTKESEGMSTKIQNACKTVGKAFTDVGKALAPISAAAGAALGFSTKNAIAFGDGMAKMSTLVDTSKYSIKDLSDQMLELSNKTGLSAEGLAEAGYQALSAGVSVDNAVGFVETAGNLAKAGFTETSTAVDVLTTAINAYKLSEDDAAAISNKLVRTQNLGKTTVDELASSMGKIIPTASSMNVNIDNLTAGYVTLTKQGIATAESTTYMNSMLNELGDSGTTVGGILKEQTGQSFQELMASGASLADVLQITKQYADDNGIAYNELWGSAEAGKAGIALLTDGVDGFNQTVQTMASNTDDVGEALEKLDTPSVKIKRSLNQVKNSGIELGTAFITSLQPTIESVGEKVQAATEWFNSLDDSTKTTIATVLLVVAAAAPVLLIIGQVITGIGTLVGVFSSLSTALMALNPIVLVVVAVIAALIAIGVALYQNWDAIKAEFQQFGADLQTVWTNIKTGIADAWDSISTKTQAVFDSIYNFLTNIWNNVGTFISTTVSTIKTHLSFAGLAAAVQGVFNRAKSAITRPIESARDAVKGIVDKIKGFFNFTVSLPHIKLPHFSISPSGWSVGDLLKGKIPTLGIKWYANGGIFDSPTIIPTLNGLKGVGEAGAEAVTPISKLQEYVRTAMGEQVNGDTMNEILALLKAIYSWMSKGGMKEVMIDVLENHVSFMIEGREVARVVRKYA